MQHIGNTTLPKKPESHSILNEIVKQKGYKKTKRGERHKVICYLIHKIIKKEYPI